MTLTTLLGGGSNFSYFAATFQIAPSWTKCTHCLNHGLGGQVGIQYKRGAAKCYKERKIFAPPLPMGVVAFHFNCKGLFFVSLGQLNGNISHPQDQPNLFALAANKYCLEPPRARFYGIIGISLILIQPGLICVEFGIGDGALKGMGMVELSERKCIH